MSIAPPNVGRLRLGPRSAGLLLTAEEFDRARVRRLAIRVDQWSANRVAHAVSQRAYIPTITWDTGSGRIASSTLKAPSLDMTIPEEEIETRQGQDRRRVDRAIWAGLGRDPEEGEMPTIVVEFVSSGKVNQERDYIVKRAEYREIGVRQYWVSDRFRRTLTAYSFGGEKDEEQLIPEGKAFETPLLPGFVLDLKRLLALADRWAKKKRRGRVAWVAVRYSDSTYPGAIWRPRTREHRSSAW